MSNSNSLFGLLVGTAVGATLGILFAPDKGSATRQRIADEALTAADKFNSTAHDLKDKASTTAHDLKEKVSSFISNDKDTLDSNLESLVKEASVKADDIISVLEKKLADLKAKNKKYQKA
ncbi:YtxH domain-containing protein [Mangrovimonas sp. YM274]|uniref:YtxH domain-containing protein n=1 Tax=Mangrovimonas sp. YM274 TaxID=3070660 RepID=UPI0027DCC03C|nr:YtxH domain-containing protein [Mangrovimonas sp. YM274]WMI67728.1 YtxH domain-containing protein [Mangrovimonas sp. YM274]